MTDSVVEPPSNSPYRISSPPEGTDGAIVTVEEYCDAVRTAEDERFFEHLVKDRARVAVDVSHTVVMTSEWFYLWERLTTKAKGMGKLLGIVGLSTTLKETADYLGVSKGLKLFSSIDEVWKK